jgi:hypothetical protein
LPQLPRLVHRVLSDDTPQRLEAALTRLEAAHQRQTRMLRLIVVVLAILAVGYLSR